MRLAARMQALVLRVARHDATLVALVAAFAVVSVGLLTAERHPAPAALDGSAGVGVMAGRTSELDSLSAPSTKFESSLGDSVAATGTRVGDEPTAPRSLSPSPVEKTQTASATAMTRAPPNTALSLPSASLLLVGGFGGRAAGRPDDGDASSAPPVACSERARGVAAAVRLIRRGRRAGRSATVFSSRAITWLGKIVSTLWWIRGTSDPANVRRRDCLRSATPGKISSIHSATSGRPTGCPRLAR